MSRAALVFACAGLGLGLAASGCSVDPRSPAFDCEDNDDCPDACTCLDGWCTAAVDVDPGAAGLACITSRTTCDEAGGCVIDCFGYQSCDQVQCPADATACVVNCLGDESCPGSVACGDVPCEIECEGADSCAGPISCSGSSCIIDCDARNTCAGDISCGDGACAVECDGRGSCHGRIDCSSSCACSVECSGPNSCASAPDCPGPAACISPQDECIVTQPACDRCGAA